MVAELLYSIDDNGISNNRKIEYGCLESGGWQTINHAKFVTFISKCSEKLSPA